jgi:CRISPR-associated protein Cas1
MQVVLDTNGLYMSVRNECFLIEHDEEKRMIHPSRITSILAVSPCRISTPAILLAAENNIPVIICDKAGRPKARLWSSGFINISSLRRAQYGFSKSSRAVEWIKKIITMKACGQANNLRYLANRKPSFAEDSITALAKINPKISLINQASENDFETCKKAIINCEAYIAAIYWGIAGKCLPSPFLFTMREKRNPKDVFNASVNYLYGMLRNQAETAVLSIGLDPALGIIHRDGYKMPSLVFDLMEPFRPVVDRMLFEYILSGKKVDCSDSEPGKTVTIAREGRKALISLFTAVLHSTILFGGHKTTLNNHILSETQKLANLIRDNIKPK